MRLLPTLLVVQALWLSSAASAQTPAAEAPGVYGIVLTAEGVPVSEGALTLRALGETVTGTIDRTGRFHLPGLRAPNADLIVRVPGHAPYRAVLALSTAAVIKLPAIYLWPATYYRARFVGELGELLAPRLTTVTTTPDGGVVPLGSEQTIDADGAVIVGPLPLGRTQLSADAPPLAVTRLPDVGVSGEHATLDGGTIVLRPGATVHVVLVDGNGTPLRAHRVTLADVAPLSPLGVQNTVTDAEGRATFARVGTGRFVVRADAEMRCGGAPVFAARVIAVSGAGVVHVRLVAGGVARLQLTSPLGAIAGASVSLTADSGAPSQSALLQQYGLPPALRAAASVGSTCSGVTDGEGRLQLTPFPPGPARLDVRFTNSRYSRAVGLPENGRVITVTIPDGFLAAQVTAADRQQPLGGARVTFNSGSSRSEATTTAGGAVLLQGVDTTQGGTLEVAAEGFEPVTLAIKEPPAASIEVTLRAAPLNALTARVVNTAGEPVAGAVVEVLSDVPAEAVRVGTTDRTGVLRLLDVPTSTLRLTAAADSYAMTTVVVTGASRSNIPVTLSRGYRLQVGVELTDGPGAPVRVAMNTGESVDGSLDVASSRVVEQGRSLSLGPLPPGDYVVEIHAASGVRRAPVRIADRDVALTIR